MAAVIFFILFGLGSAAENGELNRLEGIVRDGSHGGVPLAGAEVILRGDVDGTRLAVGRTVSDSNGRFVFYDIPIDPRLVFVPGANLRGIHYPGPRLRAQDVATTPPVTLTVYDTVESPSPLVAERFDLEIEIKPGVVEITETLLVDNPTLTTYVGQSNGMFSTTLSLSIPDGFERVTFAEEFHGRRFQIIDGHVVTDIPWTPGKRELKYAYQLRVDQSQGALERTLDLRCKHVRVRINGTSAKSVTCNLPRGAAEGNESVVFESSGATHDAGFRLQLQFGSLLTPWTKYARWGAVILFAGLVLVTVGLRRRRRKPEIPIAAENALHHLERAERPVKKRRLKKRPFERRHTR